MQTPTLKRKSVENGLGFNPKPPTEREVNTMKEHVAFNLTTGELIATTGTGNFLKRLVRKAGKGEWIFTHSNYDGMMAKYSAMISR